MAREKCMGHFRADIFTALENFTSVFKMVLAKVIAFVVSKILYNLVLMLKVFAYK